MDKAALRYKIAAKREKLTQSQAKKISRMICSKIIAIPAVKKAHNVGIYLSFRKEVLAEMLFESLSKRQKKVYAPIISLSGKMTFVHIKSLAETAPGHHGIREPVSKKATNGREIEVFIVPGLAFDLEGYRIGWGKGHYDKFFSHNKKAMKIGAAYDFQIINKIKREPHDIKMDYIVTEKRVLKI